MSSPSTTTPLKSGIQSLKQTLTGTEDLFSSSPGNTRVGITPSFLQANQNSVNIMNHVDYSFNAPNIKLKCAELTYILDNCPQKDLAAAYQKILDKVFDVRNGGRGFSVGYVLRSREPEDFKALYSFLCSTGPMLRTGSKLLSDPYIRFEFPISLLSSNTQQHIECMTATQFITSKLSPHNTSNLMLNSFEYFMFTFATYLVKPYTIDNKMQSGDSLYTALTEDYLSYFLPCDGTTPPLLACTFTVSSPSPPSPISVESPASMSHGRRSLLKHGNSILSSPSKTTSPVYHSPDPQSAGQQVYRSESMIYTFFELWMSPFCQPAKTKTDSPLGQKTSDLQIPVSDTLRIIRMLIKHLHFFVNSGGPLELSPLCQLKRTILPNVKSRIYSLFKFIFSNWPHDMSFRLVLETWLSYIQPWRYTDAALKNRANDEATSVEVDERWQQFIAENILFYTHTLRLLLPRFFRMDLTASRNALMLFRIAKIYSQNGLKELIQSAESGLDRGGVLNASFGGLERSYLDGMPSLLNYSEVSDSLISSSRQCVIELEGVAFKYEAMFDNLFRQTVAQILSMASRGLDVAEDTVDEGRKASESSQSTFEWVWQNLFGTVKQEPNNPEVEDFKKTINYLSQAIASLSCVFDLAVPESNSKKSRHKDPNSSLPSNFPETVPDKGTSCRVLTPHGRWQVLQGIAKPECRYEGDPDRVPINENEIVWLVRAMYQLSVRINAKYSHAMQTLYIEDSVLGEIARVLLVEPSSFFQINKRLDGGRPSRIYSVHRPRISLRFLGSWKCLVYLFCSCFFLSLIFGWSLFGSVMMLLLMMTVYVSVLGVFRHTFYKTQPKIIADLDSTMNEEKLE